MQKNEFDDDQLRKLLRLKNYETPGEEYYSEFLAEHRRRRAEWVQAQANRGVFARFQGWIDEVSLGSPGAWTAASAAAAAVVVFGFLVIDTPQTSPTTTVASAPSLAAPAPQPVQVAEREQAAKPQTSAQPTMLAEGSRPVIVASEASSPVAFDEASSLPVIYSDLISPVQYSNAPSQDRMMQRQVIIPVIIRSPLSHNEALDLLSPDYHQPDPEDASNIHTSLDGALFPTSN